MSAPPRRDDASRAPSRSLGHQRFLRENTAARSPVFYAIAFTAYATPEDRAQALAAGYQQHPAKPVDALDLALAVGEVVRRARNL